MIWFSNKNGLKSYATSGRSQNDVYSMFLTQESWDKFNMTKEDFDLMNYTIQIHPEQCNSCNNCVDVCDIKALKITNSQKNNEKWNYFKSIPEFDREQLDTTKVSQQQLQEPLFKYATGDDGCGEAPYLKLLSQLAC